MEYYFCKICGEETNNITELCDYCMISEYGSEYGHEVDKDEE